MDENDELRRLARLNFKLDEFENQRPANRLARSEVEQSPTPAQKAMPAADQEELHRRLGNLKFDDLKNLKRSGVITDDEYKRAVAVNLPYVKLKDFAHYISEGRITVEQARAELERRIREKDTRGS